MIACGTVLTSNGRNHVVSQMTRLMSPSATPATQSEGGRCLKCHPCHGKCRGVTARPVAPKRATRPSPVPEVPRLPRKTKVDVVKGHACKAKRRWISPSATPATQSAAASPRDQWRPSGAQARHRSQPSAVSATPVTQKVDVVNCHA